MVKMMNLRDQFFSGRNRVFLLTILLFILLFPVASMAARTVAGTVTYPGTGEQIKVVISRYAGGAGTLGYRYINADGSYSVGGLSEDICYAKTWTDAQVSYLVVQYYNMQDHFSNADSIDLVEGEVTGGINFQLEYGGGFSGTVRNGVEPVPNVSVTLHKERCNNSQTVTTFSNASGEFHIRGVPVGDYYMKLTSGGKSWWLAEDGSALKDCQLSAAVVNIIPQVTSSGFDVVLDLGSVTGTISDINSGDPLAGIGLWLKPDACNSTGVIYGISAADGRYRFANTATGTYYLRADGGEHRYWLNSSLEGTMDCSAASPISVADGVVTENIDFSLLEPGSVSGTVSDEWGNPLYEKVQVEFYLDPCNRLTSLGTAYRHQDGFYRRDGLPVGNVYLYANSWGEELSSWWHNDESATEQCLDAIPVTVVSGQVTTDLDFTLFTTKQPAPVLVPLYMLLFR